MSTINETTQQTPDAAIAAKLDELAAEYRDLNALQSPISRRIEEIKDEFRQLLSYGKHEHAGQTIAIQHNPRFDKAAFETAFPQHVFGELYKHEPDLKVIGQKLSPEQVRAFQKEGTPKVLVQ